MSLNPKAFPKLPSRLNKNNEIILKTWMRGKQKRRYLHETLREDNKSRLDVP